MYILINSSPVHQRFLEAIFFDASFHLKVERRFNLLIMEEGVNAQLPEFWWGLKNGEIEWEVERTSGTAWQENDKKEDGSEVSMCSEKKLELMLKGSPTWSFTRS